MILLGSLLAIGALATLGLCLGGKNARWLGLALPIAGVVAAPSAIGWALSQFGVVQRAVVADRRESIVLRANGGWSSRYSIAVRLPAARSGEMVTLRADQPTYDGLHFGDPVEVRSLGILKRIIRLERMPASGWIRSAGAIEGASLGWAVAMVVVGLALVGMAGRGTTAVARGALALSLIGFGGLALDRRGRPYQGEAAPMSPMATARGTVRHVWRVAELYSALGLAKPYLLVATDFTPAAARSSVLAIDALDAESVSHLEPGDQVELRYSTASPRRARLGFGARTFADRNRSTARTVRGLLIGALIAVGGLRWWLTFRGSHPTKAR